jgi:von Willebrand factor type A domain
MKKKQPISPEASLADKKWYKNVYAIIVLIGAVLGITTGLLALGAKWIAWHQATAFQNVEIVFDASAAMNEPFEGGTKRDAAIQALTNYLHAGSRNSVADADNLAFRTFGGPCDGDNTELKVDFSTGNSKAIENASRKLKPAGETTLAKAVVDATGDLTADRFKGKSKRIIVITGGEDCHKDQAAGIIQSSLNERAKGGEKIELDLRFIGLGLSLQQKEQLENVAKASGGEADFADTAKELDTALVRFGRIEPVENDINQMAKILNDVNGLENVATDLLQRDQFADATTKIADGRKMLKQSDPQFEDLGKHEGEDQFRKYFHQMYELARANRETQAKMLDLAETMIDQRKRSDAAGLEKTRAETLRLVGQYNQNVNSINDLIQQVNQQLRQMA